MYVINKVLNQHNGLIRTFVVNFQGNTRKSLKSRSFDIDQWFLFVTRKGVEEIFLSFMVGDDYRFPSYIFSCPTLRFTHGFPKLRDEFHTVAQRLKVLQKLNLTEFVPCKPYVAFINRLLSCFPALEDVVISVTRSKTLFDVEGNKEVLDYYKDEVLQFACCASTKVKISFID
nr:F-box/FBD/LRR-repeat protein At1g13570-like [Ipomoea batatas]